MASATPFHLNIYSIVGQITLNQSIWSLLI